jgi:hypothetical protein
MQTDFLFAQPRASFGWARLLAVFHSFSRYNMSRSVEEADARALYADWRITGEDIASAFAQCKAQDQLEDERQGKLFAR